MFEQASGQVRESEIGGRPKPPFRVNGWQRCSSFVPACPPQHVLVVGAERRDEFADAIRLIGRGHNVSVVNPTATTAAREFQRRGGTFIRARVEQLPPVCKCFDVICENYPYPSGEQYVPPRPFALARLSRLAPAGRWILFTEAVRFATLLKAAVEYDDVLQGMFYVSLAPVSVDAAPPSHYPPVNSRFRLVFERTG